MTDPPDGKDSSTVLGNDKHHGSANHLLVSLKKGTPLESKQGQLKALYRDVVPALAGTRGHLCKNDK